MRVTVLILGMMAAMTAALAIEPIKSSKSLERRSYYLCSGGELYWVDDSGEIWVVCSDGEVWPETSGCPVS
jgi:hypothetical protein